MHNIKSEVRFDDLNSWYMICNAWCVHSRLFNANFDGKLKWTSDNYEMFQVVTMYYLNNSIVDSHTHFDILQNLWCLKFC
jgi:hypothetical protein